MSTGETIRQDRRRQRGMTLVELMVALVLGLLITGGVIQIFIGNRATYAFNEGLSRLQENGRFALDTLNFRTRMAGYLGCLSDIQVISNLDGSVVGSLAFDFGAGLRGFEAVATAPGSTIAPTTSNPANSTNAANWSPNLPAEFFDVADDGILPTSDVIVIRNVSAAAHALVPNYNDSAQIFVGATPGDYSEGQIGVVTDCEKASVFQITGVDNSTSTGRINVTHAASLTPGNESPTAWGADQDYGPGAELMLGETWIFYVGARPDGGPPALFQQRLRATTTEAALVAEELVEGVDTMQILYGIDDGLSGDLDRYETADSVANWDDVVAVRFSLLLRSPNEYGTEFDTRDDYDINGTILDPSDDRRQRQVFTTTVAIRNKLP